MARVFVCFFVFLFVSLLNIHRDLPVFRVSYKKYNWEGSREYIVGGGNCTITR